MEEPDLSEVERDLPHIKLEYTQPIESNTKFEVVIHEETNESRIQTLYGHIERRGGFSLLFPKHSFELDLNIEASLGNMSIDDDWILNANYIDKTFIRHVLAYELFYSMRQTNKSAKCKYVDISINNQYNGLYVLMEKLDKSTLKIEDDTLSMIFKEPHLFREDYVSIIPQNTGNFHQQTFPDISQTDHNNNLEYVRDFILESSEEEFEEEFADYFDINNIIDWHLLLLVSNNSDGILKNFYLYKKNNLTPFMIAPWDYDHSFGRDGDNELNLIDRHLNLDRSILFKRLLSTEWYTLLLKSRWNELNQSDLLSKTGLISRISKLKNRVEPFVQKNFDTWPVDGYWYEDSNDFLDEIEIMYQFVDLNHQHLTEYFSTL